jgi:hypothetical protein
MSVKNFAIPLNDESAQKGDENFEELVDNKADVQFKLSNTTPAPGTNQLDLKTRKDRTTISHTYSLSFANNEAFVTIPAKEIEAIYNDAASEEWDYVQAEWTVGAIDSPSASNMTLHQSGQVYNYYGWPPGK